MSDDKTVINDVLAIAQYIAKSLGDDATSKYNFLHESAMPISEARTKGRPYGGVGIISSKSVAYRINYSNPRCLSIVLTDYDTVLTNVYLPYSNSRISAADNLEKYMEALGHLYTCHEMTSSISQKIIAGDVNCDPNDATPRSGQLTEFLDQHCYEPIDLNRYNDPTVHTHESMRIIDRIVVTNVLCPSIISVKVDMKQASSDHFPVSAEISLPKSTIISKEVGAIPRLNWKRASEKAIESYSRLAHRTCLKHLKQFQKGELNGPDLYRNTVQSLEESAQACIPKFKKNDKKRHNIPLWRERMKTCQERVNFWVETQHLQGSPRRCSPLVRQLLRISRAKYKQQLRALRREIQLNIAEHTTKENCYKALFPKPNKAWSGPINNCKPPDQPEMWRSHYKNVFKAEEDPYSGPLLNNIKPSINEAPLFSTEELMNAITCINTDKSYKRHHHWQKLTSPAGHSAIRCLLEVFNNWSQCTLEDISLFWDMFDTNLSPIPKKGKKDLSLVKSWRPISVGTSENWILEKKFSLGSNLILRQKTPNSVIRRVTQRLMPSSSFEF